MFDYSELLLPEIEEVIYSFTGNASNASNNFASHYAEKHGRGVTVHFSKPVTGSVTVEVAQAVHGMV